MVKSNHKFVTPILTLFFLLSLADLFTNGESKGLLFGSIGCLLFVFNKSKVTASDYLFAGSVIAGVVIEFVTIFFKNDYLANLYSVYLTGLTIMIYYKKGTSHE
ncbi:hypothetical protein D3C73_1289960 [compost metagenome]